MVLFHISPLLPLLTDYLNEIQQAQSKASSRAACPAPPTSPAQSMWGNKLLCIPVQTSQCRHPSADTPAQTSQARSSGSPRLQQGANAPWGRLVPGTGANTGDADGL